MALTTHPSYTGPRRIVYLCFLSGMLLTFIVYTLIPNPRKLSPLQKMGWDDSLPQSPHPVTIVTAYFAVGKAKHGFTEYAAWFKNFLSRLNTSLVIFTQPSALSILLELRNGSDTEIILYDEIWDLPWLHDGHGSHTFLYEPYHQMQALDDERDLHSPELYAVWNSKPWMMNEVAGKFNPFNSTYFYWVDIGAVRNESEHTLEGFIDLDKALSIFGTNESSSKFHKLHVFTVGKFPSYKPPPKVFTFGELGTTKNFIVGGFFGGTAPGLAWFCREFYSLHDAQLKAGNFVGKDQTLINLIAVTQPERFWLVCSCHQEGVEEFCGGRWFYFQDWYSHKRRQNGSEDETCTQAPVVTMTDFLMGVT